VVRGSWFVVVVFYVPTVPTVLQYSTDLLYMCSKQKHKEDHGHKKGHAPRAQEGHSPTGISRPCTEVLRTRTYSSAAAAKTLLRSRASRGHLNLLYLIYVYTSSSDANIMKKQELFQVRLIYHHKSSSNSKCYGIDAPIRLGNKEVISHPRSSKLKLKYGIKNTCFGLRQLVFIA